MVRKSLFTLILGTIPLLAFYSPATCNNVCNNALTLESSFVIKISEKLYLTKEGKFLEKVPCEIYLTKNLVDEYLKLSHKSRELENRYNRHIFQLLNYLGLNSIGFVDQENNTNNKLVALFVPLINNIYPENNSINIVSENPNLWMGRKLDISIMTNGQLSITVWKNSQIDINIDQLIINANIIQNSLKEVLATFEKETLESNIINPQTVERNSNILLTNKKLLTTNKQIIDNLLALKTLKQKGKEIDNFDYELLPNVLSAKSIANSNQTNELTNSLDESQSIEISPVYFKKFIDFDRDLTVQESLDIQKYLLGEINRKLKDKYNSHYSLIEIDNSRLRVKIENLSRQVTNNNWETLELTFIPSIESPQQIDMNVSAILKVQSGLKFRVPRVSNFKVSNDYEALEEYVVKLITELKQKIIISDFKLKHKS